MTTSLLATSHEVSRPDSALITVRRVLRIEAAAIERLSEQLGTEVSQAVQTIRGLS